VLEKLLLDGVAVEAGDCAKPPGNRRASPATLLEVTAEALDVRAPCLEEVDVVLLAPGGELAQVERVSLAGEPAVTGEESGESDSLGVGEYGL
jgi:hypothetical protein